MAHFAQIINGVVEQVIVAEQDFIDSLPDTMPGNWKQCSYNTHGGIHYEPNTTNPSEDQSKALRYNYPGKGFKYDYAGDAFHAPKPFTSWVMNTDTYIYEPPVAYPEDYSPFTHYWDESVVAFVERENEE